MTPDLASRRSPGRERAAGPETGRQSTEALLIAVAASRLAGLGLRLPESAELPGEPDLALYESLRGNPSGDPYFHYNALRRELDSFIACLEARQARPASRA